MQLVTKNVFIDTEVFQKYIFDFNHTTLQSFARLCKENKLFHLTTSVAKREIESNIKSRIADALDSLKRFRRNARILEKIDDDNFKPLFTKVNEDVLQARAMAVFNEFLVNSNARILGAKPINVEDILDLYFERKAPFGTGKKKSEFPDAISLQALLHGIGDNKSYVISSDKDMKDFCNTVDSLISIDTLDKLLDLYNEHESIITQLVKKYLASIDIRIKEKITEDIEQSYAYNIAPWEDSEVVEFNVSWIHDFEPAIVQIDDEECIITFDVDVDLEYQVSGPNFYGGLRDREEGRIYTLGTTSHIGASTQTFSVEIQLSYDLEDGKLINIDELEFYISGISDGIQVYVEEDGEFL